MELFLHGQQGRLPGDQEAQRGRAISADSALTATTLTQTKHQCVTLVASYLLLLLLLNKHDMNM